MNGTVYAVKYGCTFYKTFMEIFNLYHFLQVSFRVF